MMAWNMTQNSEDGDLNQHSVHSIRCLNMCDTVIV